MVSTHFKRTSKKNLRWKKLALSYSLWRHTEVYTVQAQKIFSSNLLSCRPCQLQQASNLPFPSRRDALVYKPPSSSDPLRTNPYPSRRPCFASRKPSDHAAPPPRPQGCSPSPWSPATSSSNSKLLCPRSTLPAPSPSAPFSPISNPTDLNLNAASLVEW